MARPIYGCMYYKILLGFADYPVLKSISIRCLVECSKLPCERKVPSLFLFRYKKINKLPGYSLTFLKATQLVNVKTKIQLYQVQHRNLSSNLRANRSCHAILMLLLGERAITSSERSHYLFLKAVFACNIDSKISHKDINSGRFSNRNCGMEEGAASSLADTDKVDNLTNGALLLALKASKLYFRPVVSKHQNSSVV